MAQSSAPAISLPQPSVVRGENFALRPWSPDDAAALAAIADDELLLRWAPLRRGEEDVDAWIATRADWTDHMSWAIVDADDGVLGGVSVFQIDEQHANAQLGYWLAPHARGRGVAAAAARLAAAFTFDALPVQRIALFHSTENPASCAAALRAGFLAEGTCRQAWRYPDGRLHDEHLHGLLRTDLLEPVTNECDPRP